MKLDKIKIGKLIEPYNQKCNIPNLTVNDVSGINRSKEFFEPSKQVGKDTSNYKVVPPRYFACNLMHVGRDIVLPISYNHSNVNKIVSPAYNVFKIIRNDLILDEYFFMYLKSDEKDRYFWFNTDSSVRDGMDWETFCDVEIELPSIDVQKKYVNIYKQMCRNLDNYKDGLDELKLMCEATVEDAKKKYKKELLSDYIFRVDERNSDNSIKVVKGVSTSKEFRDPTSKVNKDELSSYKIVRPRQISFVQTTHNEKVFANAINDFGYDIVVSSVNEVFYTDENKILPEYLVLFFARKEFDRYARFNSWGSARETFTWEDLKDVYISIPPINEQQAIVKLFESYKKRKSMCDEITKCINAICPLLINGSLREANYE